jgi:hypothetical protein
VVSSGSRRLGRLRFRTLRSLKFSRTNSRVPFGVRELGNWTPAPENSTRAAGPGGCGISSKFLVRSDEIIRLPSRLHTCTSQSDHWLTPSGPAVGGSRSRYPDWRCECQGPRGFRPVRRVLTGPARAPAVLPFLSSTHDSVRSWPARCVTKRRVLVSEKANWRRRCRSVAIRCPEATRVAARLLRIGVEGNGLEGLSGRVTRCPWT